ncbi:hypothetical protein, partial [Thioclava sp. F28-4]|uniref:hypothetical protein n=1 Tax=Thioclava sp. F28-4 TaxID=1915315 RepID=UPI001AEFBA2E
IVKISEFLLGAVGWAPFKFLQARQAEANTAFAIFRELKPEPKSQMRLFGRKLLRFRYPHRPKRSPEQLAEMSGRVE